MKKNIIIAAIAAASALLLSVSCQKENQPASQDEVNAGAKTFTATIEQSLTKTTITADYKVNWTSTDKISINGKSYTASPKTDAAKADFTADDGEATVEDGKYKAIYPASLYVAADNNVLAHFKLPATQTYTAGKFNAPMYAESETQTLSFKNICAVLAIKVTSEYIATLKSIKVKSDKKLNGTFTVASTADGYKAEIGSDGTKEVVLSVGETAITLTSEGTTFYVAIPEQEYSYLKIYLSEDGTLYKRAMITKKAAGLGTIECNKIYNIDYETNAVQIYANGPYWATMNIGATSSTDAGKYFSWGDVTGQTSSSTSFDWAHAPFNNGASSYDATYFASVKDSECPGGILALKNDAATVNWGAAWRMPTGNEGEFKALADKTSNAWTDNYNGVAGYKFSGQSVYSGIELFFPAAGSYGYYWSSYLNTESPKYAYRLLFSSRSSEFNPQGSSYRYCGLSVRPVSD